MLTNLHVRNLALIDEADIDFTDGLNILTGETGAGKSIILGSINIALGGKVNSDIIRQGSDYALTELTFSVTAPDKLDKLRELGIEELDDGEVIISRKITASKSSVKINGQTFTIGELKNAADILIDIHGQHDSQMLLRERLHLDMVDMYGADEITGTLDDYRQTLSQYEDVRGRLNSLNSDEAARNREIDLLAFQINEIDDAELKAGEDEELEAAYRRMSNFQRIAKDVTGAKQLISEDESNVTDSVGFALRQLTSAAAYDKALEEAVNSLASAEELINDTLRMIDDYIDSSEYDEEAYEETAKRLDLINTLKQKYGKTIEDILQYADKTQERLDELTDYTAVCNKLNAELESITEELTKRADNLTKIRKKYAAKLCDAVSRGLSELNFMNNEFEAAFEDAGSFGAHGRDKIQFMISTNVGESLKPLSKVASGGELSRIMLAFKTCMADKDNTDTLIFDEIDAGISGKTAQLVGTKMKELSKSHQIIAITHLPQIAAMADTHFIIEKGVQDNKTTTNIRSLDEAASTNELARLLGGAAITDAVLNNAREMKKLAKNN